jgi:hypothetical protein
VYEAHFTARADRYTDHDRRAADAHAAVLLTGIARLLARPFRRAAPPPRLRLVDAPRAAAAECCCDAPAGRIA